MKAPIFLTFVQAIGFPVSMGGKGFRVGGPWPLAVQLRVLFGSKLTRFRAQEFLLKLVFGGVPGLPRRFVCGQSKNVQPQIPKVNRKTLALKT